MFKMMYYIVTNSEIAYIQHSHNTWGGWSEDLGCIMYRFQIKLLSFTAQKYPSGDIKLLGVGLPNFFYNLSLLYFMLDVSSLKNDL